MEYGDLMSTLKWKELAEIEDYIGLPMDEWTEGKSKARLAFAVQYMLAKRSNPELTLDAAQELSIQELTELSGIDITDADPKSGSIN